MKIRNIMTLIIFLLLTVDLFSQTGNFEYDRTFDRCINYTNTNILQYNNRIFMTSQNAIDIFNINNDGILNPIDYYYKTLSYNLLSNFSDTLIVINNYLDFTSSLELYDIFNNNFEKIGEINLNHSSTITDVAKNDNYFFYHIGIDNTTHVLKRSDYTEVAQLSTEALFFEVNDNYLFSRTVSDNNSQVTITDISDIHNSTIISSSDLGVSDDIMEYKIKNNHLFVLTTKRAFILDISDIYTPSIIAAINYFPEQNLPYSFMVQMLFKGNFIIFRDAFSQLWVYDIFDIHNPIFLDTITEYSNLNDIYDPFILNHNRRSIINNIDNNVLFLSDSTCKMSSFDITNLPEISLIDSKGEENGYYIIHPHKFKNNIIYSRASYDKYVLSYFNPLSQNIEPTILNNTYGVNYDYPSENDSTFCYLFYNYFGDGNVYLNFCKVINDTLTAYNRIRYDYHAWNYYALIGSSLLYVNSDDGHIKISSTDDNNFSEHIGDINIGTNDFILTPKVYGYYNDKIYITYNQDYQKRLRVYENEAPFQQIADFQVSFSDNGYGIFLLKNNLILKQFPDGTKKLYLYEFPDSLEELDTIVDDRFVYGEQSVFFDNDIIYELNNDADGTIDEHNYKFIPIVNNHFGHPFYYDFEISIINFIFYPELHKFYAMGRCSIQEYSYQLDGADDDFITPISKTVIANYPNPFNPSTTISFSLVKLSKDTEIEIYNLKGQKVRLLDISDSKIGDNQVVWNGKNDDNKTVSSGVYLYRLKTSNKVITRKMLMLK